VSRSSPEFWDALAPYHGRVENHYFDLASLRGIVHAIQQPVLVVGAGQGLIVAELRNGGFECGGVDLSSEMIRYAKLRRGLDLVQADARAMPFEAGTYGTMIYATGVVDFMGDEEEIGVILNEGRRIVKPSGKVFVAFYRLSRALEDFLAKVGLLRNSSMSLRQSLEMYLLNPVQMVAWVAKQAGVGHLHAATLLVWMSVRSTMQEKVITLRMQSIFRDPQNARALINAAPEKQPYRSETEIRNLFQRLAVSIKNIQKFGSCYIVQI